jgi:MFS family permease
MAQDPGSEEQPSSGIPARLLVLVCAVVLVETIFFTALTPLLPHYVHALGLSKGQAGLLVSAYPWGTLLGAIPGGVLASRLGVRSAVLIGLAAMSVATFVFGFEHRLVLLDAARLVQGIAGACIWAGGLAWLAASASAERRGAAMGMAFGAAVGGALLGPVIGGIASVVGTGPAFAGATVAGAVLMVAIALFAPLPRADTAGTWKGLRSALPAVSEPDIALGMWLTFLAGLSFGVVDVLAPLRLNRLGASAFVIAGVFLGAAAVQIVLSPLVGRLSDHRGRMSPVRLSLVASVVVAVLSPVLRPVAVLAILLVVGLPAFGSLFVPAAAMVGDGAERSGLHHGLAYGLANLAWATGEGVASVTGGALAQATADVVPYLLLGAVLAGTALVMRRARGARSAEAPHRA